MDDTKARRSTLNIALLLILTSGLSTAQTEGNADKKPHPKAVAYVLSKVPCDNAEEVALRVFGLSSEQEAALINTFFNKFQTEDLGDGTTCYIFLPPGASGRYEDHPAYHFVKESGNLRLIFDANPYYGGYPEFSGNWNGKYLLCLNSNDCRSTEDGPIELHRDVYFWNGSVYQRAYVVTTFVYVDTDQESTDAFQWDPDGKEPFLAAHVTWEYLVEEGDTLSDLCIRHYAEMAAVMDQNGIKNPNRLTVGQRLTYDSQKNPDGKHHGTGEAYSIR